MSDWEYSKSEDELREALVRQMSNMRRSAEAYDAGHDGEAERLATVAYTLLFEGKGRTKSLLGQLGLKNELLFYNSAMPEINFDFDQIKLFMADYIKKHNLRKDPVEVVKTIPPKLCPAYMKQGGVQKFWPLCDAPDFPSRQLPQWSFDRWWDEIIYQRNADVSLSRKVLISALRSQEGGAHVDDKRRSRSSHYISNDQSVTSRLNIETNEFEYPEMPDCEGTTFPNAHWASMRQIAWEIDETIKGLGF